MTCVAHYEANVELQLIMLYITVYNAVRTPLTVHAPGVPRTKGKLGCQIRVRTVCRKARCRRQDAEGRMPKSGCRNDNILNGQNAERT